MGGVEWSDKTWLVYDVFFTIVDAMGGMVSFQPVHGW